MMERTFGKQSQANLETLHPILRHALETFLPVAPVDFGILHGWRGEHEQNNLVRQRRSQTPWPQSKHNHTDKHGEPCSLAADIYPFADGRYLVGNSTSELYTIVALVSAFKMHCLGLGIEITLGCDWNDNGIINDGRPGDRFFDAFHVQLGEKYA